MKSRTRYSLITIGIIIFILAVPFIGMFVTGIRYDFKTRRFVKTGILSVRTNPGNAKIYLNGSLMASSAATLRFLNPGDYAISIKKSGYFEWNKRLSIRGQFVTSAQDNLDSIQLFYANPVNTFIHGDVLKFFAGARKLLFISASNNNSQTIYLADVSSPLKTQQLQLPKALTNPHIIASPGEDIFLIYDASSYLVFDSRNNKIIDARTAIIPLVGENTDFEFSKDNRLFLVSKNTASEILWNNTPAAITTLILNKALACTPGDDALYCISYNNGTNSLLRIDLPSGSSTVFNQNLPYWNTAKLYLNSQNQLFIVGDGSFYALGNKLKRIADFVTSVHFYDQKSKILIGTNNEIDLYDTYNDSINFVTRSSHMIKNPQANLQAGWVFFLNDGRLQNIEIDNRDHQNNYTFALAANADADFFLDENAEYIFLADGGKLTQLRIR